VKPTCNEFSGNFNNEPKKKSQSCRIRYQPIKIQLKKQKTFNSSTYKFSLPNCRSGSKTAEQNGVKLKKFGEAVPEWLNTVSMEQWFDTQNNWAK
jgi:hypothetical protein